MDNKQELKFTLTLDQANIILASLAKQPYETVADVIQTIQTQAQEQLQVTQEAQPAE